MNDLPTISLGTNFEDIEMSDREDENLHDQKMEVVNEVSNSESSSSSTKETNKNNRRSVVSRIFYKENSFTIEDIFIGGRPPSPFRKTMGAHSAAWTTHIDAIRHLIIGRDLEQAIKNLVKHAKDGLDSPLFNLVVLRSLVNVVKY